MNVTRRKFLKAGSACALLASCGFNPSQLVFGQLGGNNPGPNGYKIPHQCKTDRVFCFNRETFASHVGTDFRLYQRGASKGHGLRLEQVADHQSRLRSRRLRTHEGECFSLYFRGPASNDLTQDVYRLEHAALGEFQLFLVPGRKSRTGSVVYEAVINRLA